MARSNGSLKDNLKTVLKNIYSSYLRTVSKQPWADMAERYRRICTGSPDSKRICCYGWAGCTRTILPKEAYLPLKYLQFEDMLVPVPNQYETILTKLYGDYMKPPPENQRTHIPFIYVDLGNGKKYVIDPIPGSIPAEEKK